MDAYTEIKLHLVREKIKQKDLAAKTGIPPQKISMALNGKTHFTLDEYGKIISALNVPADKFIKPIAAMV